MILTPLQKRLRNVGDLGKFIVAIGFKKLPKVQSGHTAHHSLMHLLLHINNLFFLLSEVHSHSTLRDVLTW